ncbi:hypothetical protein OF83DRAFT_1064375 [Amylostereum chailletii]|nr:hypothetical protein OF83DRAFT_1064375 [Amylostereum chailletii]
MSDGRRADFNSNPVGGVCSIAPTTPSNGSSTSFDDVNDSHPRPANAPLPITPKARTVRLPDVSTPRIPSSSLPARSTSPGVAKPSSRQGKALKFTTPSPKTATVHLHPALESFRWDSRVAPPSLSSSKRDSPATEPPLPKLVLSLDGLPWTVNISSSSRSTAVTVGEVFYSLHAFLRTHVTRAEWDEAGNRKDRIRQKLRTRCGGDRLEFEKGVRRVDYLPEGAVIIGLGPHAGQSKEKFDIRMVVPPS